MNDKSLANYDHHSRCCHNETLPPPHNNWNMRRSDIYGTSHLYMVTVHAQGGAAVITVIYSGYTTIYMD